MSSRKLLWLISLLLVVTLSVSACSVFEDTEEDTPADTGPATFTTLASADAYESFSANDNAIIVDVRNPDEWTTTGVPVGAALIPLPEFETRGPAELPQDKDIYVICNSGNRSRVASQILIDAGYQNVINVDGGIQAWLRNGFPTEPYTP